MLGSHDCRVWLGVPVEVPGILKFAIQARTRTAVAHMYDQPRPMPPASLWDGATNSQIGPLMPRRTSRAIPPGPPPTVALPLPPAGGPRFSSISEDDPFSAPASSQLPVQRSSARINHLSTSIPSDRSVVPPPRVISNPRRPSQAPSFQPSEPATSSSSGAHLAPPRQPPNPPSPLSPPRTSSRPSSSRRALIRALELAQQAVQLDSDAEDPYAAVVAYSQSVRLLGEVMDRVMIGEGTENTSSRSSSAPLNAREEEVRRLRSIVSTLILSLPHRLTCLFSTIHTPSGWRFSATFTTYHPRETILPPRPHRRITLHLTLILLCCPDQLLVLPPMKPQDLHRDLT